MERMTEVSAKQWDFITRENLTAREAVDFLRDDMRVRTFDDNLKEISRIEEYENLLVDGLYRIQSGKTGEIQLISLKRKVRNWVDGKNLPSDREEVFQICFAMGFDLEQSERLLSRLTEQGIHYRNGREAIFAYCLKYHLCYQDAVQMADQFIDRSRMREGSMEPLTHIMEEEFQKVRGEEDFFCFLMNHRMQMGDSHNTAYSYFTKMLALLSGEKLADEGKRSMEYIADHYLRMNMPLDKKTSGYTTVQKIVKKYWPGARNIKAMKSRSEDVNRKTLLLLYIVTGGMFDETYTELDEEYIDAAKFLEMHCKRMNQMLRDCGMARIDPRNIFDCLILYCLRPEDEMFMSDRMQSLIKELFE